MNAFHSIILNSLYTEELWSMMLVDELNTYSAHHFTSEIYCSIANEELRLLTYAHIFYIIKSNIGYHFPSSVHCTCTSYVECMCAGSGSYRTIWFDYKKQLFSINHKQSWLLYAAEWCWISTKFNDTPHSVMCRTGWHLRHIASVKHSTFRRYNQPINRRCVLTKHLLCTCAHVVTSQQRHANCE